MNDKNKPVEVHAKSPTLMELSTAIAPWTHVRRICLTGSSLKSNADTQVEDVPVQYAFDATSVVDRERKMLSVKTRLSLCAEGLLEIQAEFLLEYSIDQTALGLGTLDQIATAFGKMNGIHNIWPYWREYVQSTVARIGLPPLVIPLVTGASLLDYYAEKDKASTPQVAQQ